MPRNKIEKRYDQLIAGEQFRDAGELYTITDVNIDQNEDCVTVKAIAPHQNIRPHTLGLIGFRSTTMKILAS